MHGSLTFPQLFQTGLGNQSTANALSSMVKPFRPKRKEPSGRDKHDLEPGFTSQRQKKKAKKDPEPSEWGDAPRQFKELMKRKVFNEEKAKQKTDNGVEKAGVDRKNTREANSDQKHEKPELKIKHGESMADFSRRVNDAIPLGKAKGVNSAKAQKTQNKQREKAERLRKEYKEKLDKRRGRTADDDGADMNEDNWQWKSRERSPDPWFHLQKEKPKFGDVADRPPELVKIKIKNSVPKNAGSEARREILEKERSNVIDAYRALKAAREKEAHAD